IRRLVFYIARTRTLIQILSRRQRRLRFSFLLYKIINEHEKIKQPILSKTENRTATPNLSGA
ncbi:hypothetical protein, partial [Polycladidibacter hongkongensis]|uniref:hypothetical protein n=1 Tax=Polycladidibacter hongkongensis TaxID=1647556 RepID=UPI001AD94BC7